MFRRKSIWRHVAPFFQAAFVMQGVESGFGGHVIAARQLVGPAGS